MFPLQNKLVTIAGDQLHVHGLRPLNPSHVLHLRVLRSIRHDRLGEGRREERGEECKGWREKGGKVEGQEGGEEKRREGDIERRKVR